jgi:hypothetical protein
MKRIFVASTAALALVAVPVVAQFNLPGIPQVVHDAINHIPLAAQAAAMATQVGLSERISTTLNKIETWGGQVALAKIPWTPHLPTAPQSTSPHDTWGEMATWGATIATGQLSHPSWSAATVQLQHLAVLLSQIQPTSGTATAGGTPPILGSPLVAQLATVEVLNAAGENNLALIGQARAYLAMDLPAMQGLQNNILSPKREDNGPTQQMQYVAAGQAQNTSTAVHNLQVNTGILETLTGIAKGVADANAADLNLRIQQQQSALTVPTGITGMGSSFTNHP